mmetsp:Transcript_12458/g.37593  ORF Transcript_12458/g.37593 Transcript_12458/m.37593 type:complete len:94 (-) Transcript_12458:184-465(-)
MARTLWVLLSLLAAAAAFTPMQQSTTPVVPKTTAPKNVEVFAAAAAVAPLVAAAPAGAFTGDYLPPILVPVMTLFFPLVGMALGFMLVTAEDL